MLRTPVKNNLSFCICLFKFKVLYQIDFVQMLYCSYTSSASGNGEGKPQSDPLWQQLVGEIEIVRGLRN